MRAFFLISLLGLTLLGCQTTTKTFREPSRIVEIPSFASEWVAARPVEIYLPPDYNQHPKRRYPVLYMHDGQNLFSPKNSYAGKEWGVDETMDSLLAAGAVQPCIVVGIWNSPKRFSEYMPQKAAEAFPDSLQKVVQERGIELLADAYLKFLTTELKPFIDKEYRTLSDVENTFISGSSMGGLISLYAVCEYPDIFGRAACLSTHFPISVTENNPAYPRAVIGYFSRHLPDPATHRIYFDFGTKTLDSIYEPYQRLMDEAMAARGYKKGKNWETLKFEGAAHQEAAWRHRLPIPLKFLLF